MTQRLDKTQLEILQSLAHVEWAAADHYRSAVEKVVSKRRASELERLQREHEEAGNLICQRLEQLGAHVSRPEDVQRNVGTLVEVGGDPFEDPTAFKALKEGEELSITSYENALKTEGLDAELNRLIRDRLLPEARRRVPVISGLLEAA